MIIEKHDLPLALMNMQQDIIAASARKETPLHQETMLQAPAMAPQSPLSGYIISTT